MSRHPEASASVTAVVVAFHRPDSLRRLLAGLGAGLDVVVVDVEDDPVVREVAEAAGAEVVATAGNVGYAAAVNRGVAHVRTDAVVFMNDDIALGGAEVRALASRLGEGWDVAVPGFRAASGALERTILALPTPSRLLVEWLALPDRPLPGLGRRLRVEKWREPTSEERIDAAMAAVVACRSDLLRQMPLPEQYFLYWEESDWFYRLSRTGRRVIFDPAVRCTHEGGRAEVRPDKSRLMATNAVRCVVSTQGRRAGLLAWPIVVAWSARTTLVDLAGLAVGRRTRARVRARLAGLAASVGSLAEVVRT